MLIETGMNPSKNSLGYFGFPQTKEPFIEEVNKKFDTNFTPEDMNKAYESAMYIHYRLLLNSRSKFVNYNNLEDLGSSYNWGLGNHSKFKAGKISMPKETKDYIDMLKTIQDTIKQPFIPKS
jgi:hypothetical protein